MPDNLHLRMAMLQPVLTLYAQFRFHAIFMQESKTDSDVNREIHVKKFHEIFLKSDPFSALKSLTLMILPWTLRVKIKIYKVKC